jgi:hypothetical protein
MYDPAIGRFMQRDVLGGSMANPLALHRFVYVANNPINAVDPSGLALSKILWDDEPSNCADPISRFSCIAWLPWWTPGGAVLLPSIIKDILQGEDDAVRKPLKYRLKPHDLDWRGTGKKLKDALDEAFRRTGVAREEFRVTRWAKDAYGKSHPVEWRAPNGAEVNIDWPHARNGPDAPHVGWQTGGKRGSGGGVRGHILLDNVPYNR